MFDRLVAQAAARGDLIELDEPDGHEAYAAVNRGIIADAQAVAHDGDATQQFAELAGQANFRIVEVRTLAGEDAAPDPAAADETSKWTAKGGTDG